MDREQLLGYPHPDHHRSGYSSVESLNTVSPRAVLVSVGAGNGYRHPDPGLIGGLERAGAAHRRGRGPRESEGRARS